MANRSAPAAAQDFGGHTSSQPCPQRVQALAEQPGLRVPRRSSWPSGGSAENDGAMQADPWLGDSPRVTALHYKKEFCHAAKGDDFSVIVLALSQSLKSPQVLPCVLHAQPAG